MAGVGSLVGQNVPQCLRGFHGDGGQVDGGVKQAEQTGGRQMLCQIHRVFAARCRVWPPAPAQPHCKTDVGRQKPDCHHRHACVPDIRQDLRRRQLAVADGGGVRGDNPAVGSRRDGGTGHSSTNIRRGVLRFRVLRQRRPLHREKNLLPFQPLDDLRLHRLRRCQHIVTQGRQIHRDQQPQQYQPPQGVLHPAGDGFPEQQPQKQQGKDQNGRS